MAEQVKFAILDQPAVRLAGYGLMTFGTTLVLSSMHALGFHCTFLGTNLLHGYKLLMCYQCL